MERSKTEGRFLGDEDLAGCVNERPDDTGLKGAVLPCNEGALWYGCVPRGEAPCSFLPVVSGVSVARVDALAGLNTFGSCSPAPDCSGLFMRYLLCSL